MAVIKHNSIVAASSGKVGGNIFSRNKSGVSVRCARSSTKSQTSKSVSRRNFLRQLGVLWRTSISEFIGANVILNSFFNEPVPVWSAVGADWSQASGNAVVSTTAPSSNSRLSQYFPYRNGFIYEIEAKYLGSLSSKIESANLYIYDPSMPFSPISINVPNVSVDYVLKGRFFYSGGAIRVNLRAFGIGSVHVWEYCTIRLVINNFTDNWNQAAKNFPYSDRLGDTRTLTGQQLFYQLSLNLKELGLDPVINAPVPSLLAPLELMPGSGTSDSLIINSNQFPLHSDCAVLIFATRTFPKSVTSWKPQEMKQLRPTPEITTSSINVYSQYVSIYGASSLIVGGHVFIKVSYFDKRSGQKINSVTQSINIV